MARRRVGLWLVGAFGGVGTTITVGLAAMAKGLSDQTGLTTDLPAFRDLPLPAPGDFVVGGHEIRETSFAASAEEFREASGVLDAEWLRACRDELAAATARVRPAPRYGLSPTVAKLGDWGADQTTATARAAVDRIAADLDAFVKAEKVDHLIVLNVSSTEPPFEIDARHESLAALEKALDQTGDAVLPSSALYAMAAFRGGHTYLNFTPSLGGSFPAAHELAAKTGALYAGKDGKTGETLMKTVLAPMFAARNFQVMSWVGHNIFGNRDGIVLDDPANKASKVKTKDKVITEILGYKPASVVTIEYVPGMGDWKTAWDHIHFKGFLGTKMALQFTWQGCDSLLAAPLGVDLARLADLEKRRGGKGLMLHLSCFFKGPEGDPENNFAKQFARLEAYVAKVKTEAR